MSGAVVVPNEAPPAPATPGLSPAHTRRATWVLIALRAGYAYNWFTIGPAFTAIGASFSVGEAEWGLLLAAFLGAAGLLQVPAGLLARRYGTRPIALGGAGLLAVASIASGFAPNFATLLALRALAGAGAALFFSPAIGLVGSLYPEGKRGLPVGTFSSAFSGGAALGVVVSAIVVGPLGWQADLALGGLGLLLLTGVAYLLVPRRAGAPPRERPAGGRFPDALRLRSLWAIGIAFVGLEGASFATGQFLVPYGEGLGWSAAVAGGVAMAFVLPSLFGGPVGGVLAESYANRRAQFVVATGVGAALVAAIPWVGIGAIVVLGVAFSFGYGFVYAVMYVLPNYLPRLDAEDIPIGIGLFNSIQLAGGAVVNWGFGVWAAAFGYPWAWSLLAIAVVLPLAALAYVPATGRARRGGAHPRDAASGGPRPGPAP